MHSATTGLICFLGLLMIAIVSAKREKVMEDRLFNRYCPSIRTSQVCKYMDSRGAFDINMLFPNGCNMCRCIFPLQGTCEGPTCPTAEREDEAKCDQLLSDIRLEINKRHTECVKGSDFCPKYPNGVYSNGCNNCFCRSAVGFTCQRSNVCKPFIGSGAEFADYCRTTNAGLVAKTWDEYLSKKK